MPPGEKMEVDLPEVRSCWCKQQQCCSVPTQAAEAVDGGSAALGAAPVLWISFAISAKWYRDWQQCCRSEQGFPGPIDNSPLFDMEDKLRPGLTENVDYVFLTAEAWNLLVGWFGMTSPDHEIRRIAQSDGVRGVPEMYPLRFTVVYKGEQQTISVSRFATLNQLHELCAGAFGITNNHDIRLSVYENDEYIETLPTGFSSLNTYTIGEDKIIAIEHKDVSGKWKPVVSQPAAAAAAVPRTSSSTIGGATSYSGSSNSNSTASLNSVGANKANLAFSNKGCYFSDRVPPAVRSSAPLYPPGLTGLGNIGNTCFMNSALQCLSNTVALKEFFISGKYESEINASNPIGRGGRLAKEFAHLLESIWSGNERVVIPRELKYLIAEFAPQFSGYQQHDSQELLAFLLDGIHEDLNRILKKPFVETITAGERSHDEVAEEAWEGHLSRNSSIITDLFHGQYRSTLICPKCNEVAVTFDPFMYLSLPLPAQKLRREVFVTFADITRIVSYDIAFEEGQTFEDFAVAVSEQCGVPANRLTFAEMYSSYVSKLFSAKDAVPKHAYDDLYAFEMPAPVEENKIIPCFHSTPPVTTKYTYSSYVTMRPVGTPFLVMVPKNSTFEVLEAEVQRAIAPFMPGFQNAAEAGDSPMPEAGSSAEAAGSTDASFSFLIDDGYKSPQHKNIPVDKPIADLFTAYRSQNLVVCWENGVPERVKNVKSTKAERPVASNVGNGVPSVQDCLQLFTSKERLSKENAWRCSGCKEEVLAQKQLALWRLPEILIIHLKRFSYTSYYRDKISCFIDFPIQGLDLSAAVESEKHAGEYIYDLYAVSNHMGGYGGGHYTAHCLSATDGKWHLFDDSHVSSAEPHDAQTKSSYILFYRRRTPGAAAPAAGGVLPSL
eukprot:m.147519 g.147519  ORF g.147519 m.147519 type:complete len:890 (-) comp10104_c1_seq8:1707-4376(-)